MKTGATLLFNLCWFCLGLGQVNAQYISNKQFHNIVIGEGCASTCINGYCEKICGGNDASQIVDEGSAHTSLSKGIVNGCASNCINGQCENTCRGSDATEIVEKDFVHSGFSKVVSKGIDTRIQYGQDYDIKLIHVPESVDDIDVVVDGETLTVSFSKNYKSRFEARLEISMPILTFFRVEGNADSSLANFTLDSLEIQAVNNVNINGEGNHLEQLVLQVGHNVDVNFIASKVVSANVKMSGNATVQLSFADQARAMLSGVVDGMADLLYCGSPDQSLVVSDMSDVSIISCD